MSTEKTYLCDEYKLYFKIEDDVQILHNEVELYNTSFVGNNSFCHEEYIDGQRALTYSIPAMITMNQFITKKIHRDELVDIMFSITDQLMYLKANDMPLGKVILNIGYMYLNLEDMSVQLVFLPIDNNVHPEDEQHFIVRPQMAEAVEENTEAPLQTTVVSTPSFKLAKEVKDYSGSDIGFDDDESDATSTTVLTNATKGKPGPVIVRTRTGERIKIDKPIFCIGKSAQGVDYQVTDNNSVSRRHAYIINVNGVYYLRDNKSTNHTYLGGKIINSGTDMMLIDGSKFKLANEEFTFREK